MEDNSIELIMKITLNSAETYIEPSNFISALLRNIISSRNDYSLLEQKNPNYNPDNWHWYALGQTDIIKNLAYDLGIDKKKFKKELKHHNDTLYNMYKNELKRIK